MTKDQLDVVVVGGGVAGLCAAWRLGHRDVLVLERDDRVGGRLLSGTWNGVTFNLGAQYVTGGVRSRLLPHLDLSEMELPHGSATFFGGRLFYGTPPFDLLGLSTPDEAERELATLWGQMITASGGGRLRDGAALEVEIDAEVARLDAATFADFVREHSPALAPYCAALLRSLACKEASSLSALFGATMLASEGGTSSAPPCGLEGGTAALAQALSGPLGNKVLSGSSVERVVDGSAGVEVTFLRDGSRHTVRARYCVFAAPATVALAVIDDLSDAKRKALGSVRYGRFLTAGLWLEKPVWNVGGWGMAVELPTLTTLLDASFDAQRDGPAVLSAYASDTGSNAIWDRADEEIVDLYVEEAATVFPDVKRHTVGGVVQRWDEGYPAWEPGHFGHLAEMSAPVGHVHFCGDYLAIPSIEGAMGSALRTSDAVEELLGAGQ